MTVNVGLGIIMQPNMKNGRCLGENSGSRFDVLSVMEESTEEGNNENNGSNLVTNLAA